MEKANSKSSVALEEKSLGDSLKHYPELYAIYLETHKAPEFKIELDKFRKYTIGDTGKFINYLRKIFLDPSLHAQIKFTTHPYLIYLGNLHILSTALWYQHELMQNLLDQLCFWTVANESAKLGDRWIRGTNNFHIMLSSNNYQSMAAFCYFCPLLFNGPTDINDEMQKIINDLNNNEDPEISQLACVLNLKVENNFINQKSLHLHNIFSNLANQLDQVMRLVNMPEVSILSIKKYFSAESVPGFLKNNKKYLDECYLQIIRLNNLKSLTPKAITMALQNCIIGYATTSDDYEKLYQLIRKEVKFIIKECQKANLANEERLSTFLNNQFDQNKTFDPALAPLTISKNSLILAHIHESLKSLKDISNNTTVSYIEDKFSNLALISNVTKIPSKEFSANAPDDLIEKKIADSDSSGIKSENSVEIEQKQNIETDENLKKKKHRKKAKNKYELPDIKENIDETTNINYKKEEDEHDLLFQNELLRRQKINNNQSLHIKNKNKIDKVKISSDESYILNGEETQTTITIHDPKNKMKIILDLF